MVEKLVLSEAEWRARLTPEEFAVLRGHGTERPHTGCFVGTKVPGVYTCAGCHQPLFRSGDKFESGTGWPSFTQTVSEGVVTEIEDRSYGMRRVEVRCSRCDGHLGHVFPDGPAPTYQRYCINSVSLRHTPDGVAQDGVAQGGVAQGGAPDAVASGR